MSSDLPPGWSVQTLGSVLTLKRGYDLPARERREGTIPIVSSSGVSGWHDQARVAAPGVVTGRYGTIGEVFFVEEDFWPLNTALYVQDFKGNDPRYCAELLKILNFHAYDGKSGVPGINRNDLHMAEVPLAPPEAQVVIAATAGAIDDKVASNQRLIGLLRELMAGLFARHVLRAQPDDGWARGDLTSIARFVNGRAFTKEANGEGRPILRIKELNGGLSSATPYSDIEASDDNIAREDDLLFSWSGSLEAYRWSGPESLINQHIFKVLPHDGVPPWFVEGWLRHHMPEFQRIAKDKATTMGHIKREHLNQALVTVLPAADLAELDGVMCPLDALAGGLARETRTLQSVRDELLPRMVRRKAPATEADITSLAELVA